MKGKHNKKPTSKLSKSNKTEEESKPIAQDSEDEQSFSNWLRSDEGVENLKLFIVGNSIIVFLVLSWPNIKETLDAMYYSYIEYTERK
ncbi:unnamed protein product [Psylliodes chrysocephalus]|uniref:Uncharacterized protein n=1 Tax=Psylliodes chrysocephalus TaxID=3402493 RepID=A0A9P0GCD2_9CUCU|nr:unnamed protein product [Psylliodes chrysocephala]